MSGALQAVFQNQRSFAAPPGQDAYTTNGTFSWVAPAGVTSVSVVCVGLGGANGGALAYKNNITVIPGNSYSVVIPSTADPTYFISSATVAAASGLDPNRPTGGYLGDGGGQGGSAAQGAGGAGGYSGNGGDGGYFTAGSAGAGGGGGGGGTGNIPKVIAGLTGGGGGVGILGQGSNGAGGTRVAGTSGGGGGGGSGGANGQTGTGSAASGGLYGGGGAGGGGANGGRGAVRIIWPGTTRAFPSTDTGDL